jgi:hypothetical protein
MREPTPEQIKREQEQAIIEDVQQKIRKLRSLHKKPSISINDRVYLFNTNVILPFLKSQILNGQPPPTDIQEQALFHQKAKSEMYKYKLYHAIIDSTISEDLSPLFDFEGEISYQKFVDGLYDELVTKPKNKVK